MIHGLAPRSTIHGLVRHLPGQHDQQSHAGGGAGVPGAAVPGPVAPDDPWATTGRDSAAWDQAAIATLPHPGRTDREAMKAKVAAEVGARIDAMMTEDEINASPWGREMLLSRAVMGESPGTAIAATFHQEWAQTSGDSSARAIAVQRAAAREFDLEGADPHYAEADGSWKPAAGPPTASWLRPDIEQANDRLLRTYVRAEYENTQAALKARGITELELYRGIGESGAPGGRNFTGSRSPVAIRSNPLSSWGATPFSGQSFAADRAAEGPAYVMSIRVPASRVFSTAFSGAGCLPEYEAIILAGPGDKASVRRFEP